MVGGRSCRGGRSPVRRVPGLGALARRAGRGQPRARPDAAGGVEGTPWSASGSPAPVARQHPPRLRRHRRPAGSPRTWCRVGAPVPHGGAARTAGRTHWIGARSRRWAARARGPGSPLRTATRWPTPRASRSSTCATTRTGRRWTSDGGARRRLPDRRVGEHHAGGARRRHGSRPQQLHQHGADRRPRARGRRVDAGAVRGERAARRRPQPPLRRGGDLPTASWSATAT